MKREEFMDLVYDELNSDPDNNRANRIIEAADEYADDSEPTLKQVELYCKRRCLTVITDEMLAKLKEDRDSIPAAIPVAWITAKIERMKGMDNMFASLTADVIATALNEWRKEQKGAAPARPGNGMTDLYVRDRQTGEIHRIGDDHHDQLTYNERGQICYHNLQNGDGCRTGDGCDCFGYEFVMNEDDHGYNMDPREQEARNGTE